ncbi:MAG: NF038122 family metalloprotease, partial [Blastocatellia bacterium]
MKPLSNFLKVVTRTASVIVLFVCLFAGKLDGFIFHHSSAAQNVANDQGQISAAPYADGFVISNDQGRITCRAVTPEEAKSLMRREPDQQLRVISPADPDLRQQQTGLKIILRGTAQLDNFPTAKNAFIKAAQTWEALIRTPITVVIDVDFGPTFFGQPYERDTIGSTRGQLIGSDTIYPAVRTALLARASSAPETTLYNSAPNGVIPTDIGSTAAMFAPSPLFRVLGFISATADPDAERQQLGPPPSIGFNSAMNFDFEPADGIASDKVDFDATAVHEIGHVLGFTSNVGVKELLPDEAISASVWDLFRFRPGVTPGSFNTAQRILSSGGDHVFFDSNPELALSTGRPNGQGGDGNQASHWKDDRLTGRYIGTMDPSIAPGRRDPLTEGDLRAIDVMGYQLRTSVTQQTQEVKIDDGTSEGGPQLTDGLMAVNRLTPPVYPATLSHIRIQFRTFSGQPDPTGKPITLVYFTDANGSGAPPSGAQITRISATVPGTSATNFFDFPITNGPTINAGDFYVGFAAPTPHQGVGFPLDSNSQPMNRSFLSLNNGTSFLPIGPPPGTTSANAMIRANVSTSGSSLPAIEAPAALDFGSVATGSSVRRLLTIRNTGVAILNVTGITS